MPTLQQALAALPIKIKTKPTPAVPASFPRPPGPRLVPLGTFETSRKLHYGLAEPLDRSPPVHEPNFSERYFP